MLLQEEQYIIHWLTEYGALTKTQVVRMLKDKPPQTAEKIIRGLKRDVLLYDISGGYYLGVDPMCQPDPRMILAVWVLLQFIDKVEPMAHYYIILDDQNSSLEFLSALFFAFLFIKLVRYADSTPEQRCKVPVNIILDEMNNIGTIKDFGRRLSTIRSRALQVIMCSQSLPQLQNRYPNNLWAELLGNADTQIMLGATDDVTAEYFSARSGDMTVEVNSTMTTRQSLALAQVIPQYRYTEGIGRRRVLTPDEVLRLPNDELLIILRGQKVLRAKKFDFTEHPYAKECERTSIQRYQTDPAPAQPLEPPAQSMPAEPDMDKPPGPAPAAAAKPPVKAKPPQAKPKAPVPKSPSSGGQPSEFPAKSAKRPKTLYESSRPPADF